MSKAIKEKFYRFIHEDCLKGMRRLQPASVDCVVTSPPYNLGIKYGAYDDSIDRGDYLQWSRAWAEEVRRILKPDGSFFLNVGASPRNPLLPYELVLEMRRLFVLQNTFHWIKSITVETREGGVISAGHFKPINSKRFVNDCHEYVFHLTQTGAVPVDRLAVGVPYQDKSNITRWGHTAGNDKRCRGNTWFVPYKTIQLRDKDRPHPATFPTELARRCITLHGVKPGTVVMDPFVGIGHAAMGAAEAGARHFIGFDIDRNYLEMAVKECRRFFGGDPDAVQLEAGTPDASSRNPLGRRPRGRRKAAKAL